MKYTAKQKSAVKGRITRFSKLKGIQNEVVNKLQSQLNLGRTEVGFATLSDVSKAALYKTGFKVTKGENVPPDHIRYIVSWKDFVKLKK